MTINIDIKDKKILAELDFTRKSNSEIAKKVKLSKQGVDYRIKQLLKNKVIFGFYPIINNFALGYIYGRLLIKFQNLTKEKEQTIYKKIKNNPNIKWVLRAEGNYDLIIGTWVKSLKEFKELSESILLDFGAYVKEKKESIGISLTQFPNNFLLEQDKFGVLMQETIEIKHIDDIDKKILKEICNGEKINFVDIANNIKLNPKIVSYRIKKLEEKNIILGYRPLINHKLLGFTHFKILFYLTNVTKQEFDKIKEYFKNNKNVIYIVEEIGICDIDIELMFKSTEELFEFIKNLKFTFPTLIKEYETLIISDTLKITYLPF